MDIDSIKIDFSDLSADELGDLPEWAKVALKGFIEQYRDIAENAERSNNNYREQLWSYVPEEVTTEMLENCSTNELQHEYGCQPLISDGKPATSETTRMEPDYKRREMAADKGIKLLLRLASASSNSRAVESAGESEWERSLESKLPEGDIEVLDAESS